MLDPLIGINNVTGGIFYAVLDAILRIDVAWDDAVSSVVENRHCSIIRLVKK